MSQIPAHLQDRMDNGYSINISEAISEGWRLFTRQPILFVGAVVLFFIASMVAGFIPIIGSLAGSLILTPCFMGGIILVCLKLDRQQPITFNDFFEGFNHLKELVIAAVLTTLIIVGAAIPMGMLLGLQFFTLIAGGGAEDFEVIMEQFLAINIGLIFLLGLLVVYAVLATSWTYHLVLLYNMQAWDAIVTSFKLVNKQILMLLLLYIVLGLFMFFGLLALVVGILFAYPFVLCSIYAAFKQASGFNPIEEDVLDDDITAHLVG